MVEEPFLLRLILTVLPELMKRHPKGANISRTQVYEAFNEQWINLHAHTLSNKLSDLRIQVNVNKMKIALQKYCEELGFEMFLQASQVATERTLDASREIDSFFKKVDPVMDTKSEKFGNFFDEFSKFISRTINDDVHETKTEDSFAEFSRLHVWDKYFQGDSLAKCILRRLGKNQYSFLHKSFQEYFAAHAIIYDILSWRPTHFGLNNNEFQRQFQEKAHTFKINSKLLNEDMEVIYFIVEKIRDQDEKFVNLKSRLLRIIESSKTNQQVQIGASNAATILNAARANLHDQNWDNIQIPHAILDMAFLEGTTLVNANLNNVSFSQAFLRNTNFKNAKLKGVNFGEYPYLEGHSDAITSIHYSPDGRTVVSGSTDKTIRIWDLESRKEIQKINHTAAIHQVQYSPDGKHILSCSIDATVRIWDTTSGELFRHFQLEDTVLHAQYSFSGHMIVACSKIGNIQFWDVNSGRALAGFNRIEIGIQSVQFSPDDSMILGCLKDSTIRLWNINSKKEVQVFKGHSDLIKTVQYSHDKRTILSCSTDKTIRIWDVESGNEIQKFVGHLFAVDMAQFSPDDRTIVSCSKDRTIRIWNVESGRESNSLEGHLGNVTGVLYSSDGSTILSCSVDKTIRRWDAVTKQKLIKLDGHKGAIKNIRFSPDGLTIASGSADKTIRIWDTMTGRELKKLENHTATICDLHYLPGGHTLVSCSVDGTIRICDVSSEREIKKFEGHSNIIMGLHYSPDGGNIVSAGFDNTVRIWDVRLEKEISKITAISPLSVQYSPDGRTILIGVTDIRVYDLVTCAFTKKFKGHEDLVYSIHFSPDRQHFSSCSFDKTIRIWNFESGKQIHCMKGHSDIVNEIQYSPDGTILASCSNDKTIRIWDVKAGKRITTLRGHSGPVCGISFSPDGCSIVSSSSDRTIRLWVVDSGLDEQRSDVGNTKTVKENLKPSSSYLWRTGQVRRKWQVGVDGCGLTTVGSTWEGVSGLEHWQKLLVKQRGGKF
ncbi:WD-40 repeat-containing protein [Reticulomyxa filosa]|uniref:WD-40 repeat-containing protein n=1 Tax=Reticulomyxa filosa TaxID=46433 RepID=X6NSA3_RETFI|nr:WD-40 repeat-containing protein [Reticulomyxa filosa]|eukprot:ETO28818.1 WD-40 repeat-containing protein [Reticulomyxa filosa]